MEEKFDKQLSGQIRKVFEEYEDASAEEGWNRFRQKYPDKERRRRIFDWWWTSFVAVALLLLAFWLFWPVDSIENKSAIAKTQPKTEVLKSKPNLNQTNFITKNTQQKKHVETLQYNQKNAVKIVSLTTNNSNNPISMERKNQQQLKPKSNLSSSKKYFLGFEKNVDDSLKQEIKVADTFMPLKEARQAISRKQQQQSASKSNLSSSKSSEPASKKYLPEFEKIKVDSLKEEIKVVNNFLPLKEARQITLLQSFAQKQTLSFQAEVKLPVKTVLVIKANVSKKKDAEQSKFGFAAYVDTHLNYAQGSNNNFGFGAGFSFDYKLTKKLKLATGLALIQNKLFYTNNFPQNGQAAVINYAASVSTPTATGNIQTLNSLNANLLTLDIPINLKYQFYTGKNSMFIAAGFSSTTFVKESYSYNYTNSSAVYSLPSQSSSVSTTTQQSVKSSKSFDSFDFAKTLNLSFGFAYTLGKNQIEIEPFLKYPLGGLGSQQLHFSLAGINLKLNFQSTKK